MDELESLLYTLHRNWGVYNAQIEKPYRLSFKTWLKKQFGSDYNEKIKSRVKGEFNLNYLSTRIREYAKI